MHSYCSHRCEDETSGTWDVHGLHGVMINYYSEVCYAQCDDSQSQRDTVTTSQPLLQMWQWKGMLKVAESESKPQCNNLSSQSIHLILPSVSMGRRAYCLLGILYVIFLACGWIAKLSRSEMLESDSRCDSAGVVAFSIIPRSGCGVTQENVTPYCLRLWLR